MYDLITCNLVTFPEVKGERLFLTADQWAELSAGVDSLPKAALLKAYSGLGLRNGSKLRKPELVTVVRDACLELA